MNPIRPKSFIIVIFNIHILVYIELTRSLNGSNWNIYIYIKGLSPNHTNKLIYTINVRLLFAS